MSSLVHADVFFFVSTIALVVLSVGIAIGLYYAINILRDVREVSRRIRKASVDIERDIEALRTQVKSEGQKVKGIADMILGFIMRRLAPKMPRRKKPIVEVDLEEEADL